MRPGDTILAVFMFLIFAGMVVLAVPFPHEARLLPLMVGLLGAGLCVIQLSHSHFTSRDEREQFEQTMAPAPLRREVVLVAWFAGFVAGIIAFGFLIAGPLLVFAFLMIDQRKNTAHAVAIALGCLAFLYLAFEMLLELTLFRGLLMPFPVG